MTVVRLSLPRRLCLNCVGCGVEPATVAIGNPDDPDETYGLRCWADVRRWKVPRPAHTHVDGHDCDAACQSGDVPHDLFEQFPHAPEEHR